MANILIADDDDILAELVRLRLEGSGHNVEIATDGASALDRVRSTSPDLIVLDSMMPVFSGPEVLRALGEDPKLASIPVLMLTARKGQEDVVSALRGGASEYMTKPFIPEELIVRVEKLLSTFGAANA